jgi:branched-chain amino acid transport system permease protein
LVAAAVAFVLGLATTRLSGFHLVAMTLLFVVAFEKWTTDAKGVTGGAGGLAGLRHLSLNAWGPTQRQLAAIFLVLACLVAFAIDRLRLSRFGVTLRSIREVPVAVEATGVPVAMATLVALSVGAAVSSLGGTVFVASVGGLNTETFSRNILFLALFMPIIGGVGSPWGSLVGALVVVQLTLNVSLFTTSGLLVLVSGVLIIQLAAPRGLLGYLAYLRNVTKWLNRSKVDVNA